MKFTIASVVLSLAYFTLGATIKDLPACAVSCFTAEVTTEFCNPSVPYTLCHCTNGELRNAFFSSINPCLYKNCAPDEVINAIATSLEICNEIEQSNLHQDLRRAPQGPESQVPEQPQTTVVLTTVELLDTVPTKFSDGNTGIATVTLDIYTTSTTITLSPTTSTIPIKSTFSTAKSTAPSTSPSLSVAQTSSAPPTQSSPPSTDVPPQPRSGLSGGAKAGIAIGVILSVAVISSLSFFLLKKRKQDKDSPAVPFIADDAGYQVPAMASSTKSEVVNDQPILARRK